MAKSTISRALLVVLLLVVAWLAGALGQELYQRYRLQQDIDTARAKVSDLQKDNENLAAMIQSFSQSETLELEARKRLNLQKPGEQVVIVVPGSEDDESAQQNSAQEPQTKKSPATDSAQDESEEDALKRRAGEWWSFVFQ